MTKLLLGLTLLVSMRSFAGVAISELKEGQIYHITEQTTALLECYNPKTAKIDKKVALVIGPESNSLIPVREFRYASQKGTRKISGGFSGVFKFVDFSDEEQYSLCSLSIYDKSLTSYEEHELTFISE